MANYLRIVYHCHVLQIYHVDCPAMLLSRTSYFLLLATTQIYKNDDYKPHCPFYGAQYIPDLLHECHKLPLEFISSLINFDSELQLINSGLVQSPVLLSGWGEKLLERNGHNLRQYGILKQINVIHTQLHSYCYVF